MTIKKYHISFLTIVSFFFSIFIFGSLFAQDPDTAAPKVSPQTSHILSLKCTEQQIKDIAGSALLKIGPPKWAGQSKGFEITLDTSKMTFSKLTQKMQKAGCF